MVSRDTGCVSASVRACSGHCGEEVQAVMVPSQGRGVCRSYLVSDTGLPVSTAGQVCGGQSENPRRHHPDPGHAHRESGGAQRLSS